MSKFGLYRHSFAGHTISAYLKLTRATFRWQVEGNEHVIAARATGAPLLWTFWHGQLMLFFQYVLGIENVSNFVLVAVGDERFRVFDILNTQFRGGGVYPVDMQGNPFKAGLALLHVIKALKGGKQSFLAPDGPDGPAFVAKPGIGYLARKARATILPVGSWTRQSFQLNRWDRYLVPLPFARCHLVVGKPIVTCPEMNADLLLAEITETLNLLSAQAQVLAKA